MDSMTKKWPVSGSGGGVFSRRALLAGVVATACSRKRASRYHGWLFVSSGAAKSVAVADLAFFRRVTNIPLGVAPDQLFHSGGRVFAVCHDGQSLMEIDPVKLAVAGKIGLPGKPVSARLAPDGASALILTEEPNLLLSVDLAKRRVTARLPLPGGASSLDLNDVQAAISIPSHNSIARVSLPSFKMAGITDVAVPCAALRFRRDGKTILAGATAAREIVTIDSASGKLLAEASSAARALPVLFQRRRRPDVRDRRRGGRGRDREALPE